MFNLTCNIDSSQRVTRVVLGVVLLIGALLGLGRFFLLLVGIILVAEAFLGWCAIPILAEKLKLDDFFRRKPGD